MRRQIIVVFLNCLCLVALPAAALDRGALFKITGNGHVRYLFGEDKVVAVGVLHLLGKQGVPVLMRARRDGGADVLRQMN